MRKVKRKVQASGEKSLAKFSTGVIKTAFYFSGRNILSEYIYIFWKLAVDAARIGKSAEEKRLHTQAMIFLS